MNTSAERCEWFYLDGTQCQNVMSVKSHHRTYDSLSYPLSNISLFCPAHHVVADIERKRALKQREDIILERIIYVLSLKRDRLGYEKYSKFSKRLLREMIRTDKELCLSQPCFIDICKIITQAEFHPWFGQFEVSLDAHLIDLFLLKRALYYLDALYLCISTPEIELLKDFFDRNFKPILRILKTAV